MKKESLTHQLNKQIAQHREDHLFDIEIIGDREALNELLDEFTNKGYLPETEKPLDGDYVKLYETKMVNGILGHYRGIPIRLTEYKCQLEVGVTS